MIISLKTLAVLLVAAGCLLLLSSFMHRSFLCNKKHTRGCGWNVLFTLNVFFILGYLGYLWGLINRDAVTSYELMVSLVFFGGGCFVAMVIAMSTRTVSNIQEIAKQDRHNALHDGLTQLPNRSLLFERIEQAILHARRNLNSVAIILLDLDHFKDVNDTLGHAIGDIMLKLVAPRLSECVREIDTIARLGGDEFAAVLPSANEEDAIMIARKLADYIDQPFEIEGHILNVGVSMGIAIYPLHGHDAETLLQKADIAMYQAKYNAQDYNVYDITEDRYSLNRLELVSSLRDAVRKKEFYIEYQPILDIGTGEIGSVEALLRYKKDGKNISPETFIPIVEHLNLMNELTLWVIEKALLQCKEWRDQGLDINVAVNVSARNLNDPNFPSYIGQILNRIMVLSSCLRMEITESSIMHNPARSLKLLTEISELGVEISIDDFGTGYSSLTYLKNLPARQVKIDRSFITNIMENDDDAVIVCATIGMAHDLGYKIVAEGIEDGETLDFIKLIECDIAQGYFISRPLDAGDVYNFIAGYNVDNDIDDMGEASKASIIHGESRFNNIQ